jgi:hypothetical protein
MSFPYPIQWGKFCLPAFFGDKTMKQIAMQVNQGNLVKSLKFSFTNQTTVLGELMQNARRAGATAVHFEFAPETNILRFCRKVC